MGHARVTARRRRRIAVVTGTRAEYGLLRSTLAAIRAHPKLELQLVVTGMHLLRKFGRTLDVIRADGFPIAARVPMQRGRDAPLEQAAALSRGVAGIARFLERAQSDVVLVLGDRIEAMAAALAGVSTGRFVAHIHGGDVAPGDFDDALRHAITKLAHLHFPATRRARLRLLRMGERPRDVFLAGAPGLDDLRATRSAERRRSRADGEAIVLQHPCGRPASIEERVMTDILEAVRSCGMRRTILYPNSDRGHDGVIRAIRRHALQSGRDEVRVCRSLPREDFLRALSGAAVLVGNSSAGIIEAPFVGTPSVDVGDRQAGREPGGPSIVHAEERRASLESAIRRTLRRRFRRPARSVYGDGRTGARIARILASVDLSAARRRKRITYA